MADTTDIDYAETWKNVFMKKVELTDRRATLEAELSDINTQIGHLNEIMSHLAPLAGVPAKENLATLGITDAIRWVMEKSKERMAPKDVHDELREKGFDMSTLSAPMASIYKILARLAGSSTPEILREKEEDGKVFYRWIEKSDDIPF
ncbi:hypothetical protein [Edaphobacter albus]|uniref:hypothetical protein n=1 Tax=Edaphobacter sp. 4G125 TaxID=2763071 RepID=UPI00164840A7|nr:hypothetical protein [Edaphobacter sp. 4G125]QNI37295.1 hypothetical protein H7846_02965 [Edaphobacter sp. 4G125]